MRGPGGKGRAASGTSDAAGSGDVLRAGIQVPRPPPNAVSAGRLVRRQGIKKRSVRSRGRVPRRVRLRPGGRGLRQAVPRTAAAPARDQSLAGGPQGRVLPAPSQGGRDEHARRAQASRGARRRRGGVAARCSRGVPAIQPEPVLLRIGGQRGRALRHGPPAPAAPARELVPLREQLRGPEPGREPQRVGLGRLPRRRVRAAQRPPAVWKSNLPRVRRIAESTSMPSTRHLLDGVAMLVPHRSTRIIGCTRHTG